MARRINHAFTLLNKEIPQTQIAKRLSKKFGTSRVQAYRYLQQAKEIEKRIAVPETSAVFTVKLPPSLIRHIRKYASAMDISISKAVRMALEDFLAAKSHGQTKKAS